ncbi:MAG: hypothetical protein P8P74_08205 [Crocinitomicaceae bacterium]|nr:hypothetical protein [Crocinitomicaceae bacterium]
MSLRDFTFILNDISEYSYLLVGIFAFIAWKKFGQFQLLWVFLLLAGAIRVTTIFLAEHYQNTHPYYHLLGLIELTLIYLIYSKQGVSKKWNYVILAAASAYIANSVFIRSLYEMNSFALALVQIVILSLGFNYMYRLYASPKRFESSPFFYINAGFMFYAVGSFFVNLLSSKIVSQSTNDFFHNAWILESFSAIIRLSIISYGLTLLYRER